jgi:exopolysaccharide biosynthesis polyprenyl glycosylphosphotransferase
MPPSSVMRHETAPAAESLDHDRSIMPPSIARARDALPAVPRIAYRLPALEELPAARRRRRRRSRRLVGLDVVVLVAAVAASAAGAGSVPLLGPFGWALAQVTLTVVLIAGRGGYRPRLETSAVDQLGNVLGATGIAAMVVITTRVIVASETGIGAEVVRLWVFSAAYLVAARVAVAIATQRKDRRGMTTIVVGAGSIGQLVARRLLERPEMGLNPVGFLDKEPLEDRDDRAGLPVLGASWDLEEVVHRVQAEHVIVTFSTAPHDVLLRLVRRCRALGLDVSLVPRLFEEISNRVSVEHLGGVPLLRVDQADPRGWQFEIKYALDRLGGVLVVLGLAPMLLAIAALVRLTSPGSILFRQTRVGLDGREFDILKFRTMRVAEDAAENDAAWAARALGAAEQGGTSVDVVDRRTPVGRFLRRWSLDELPQFINIAKGDMSFIGPRPERTGYVRAFEGYVYRYGDRHRVKSGVTGWAQVHGLRGETSLADRVEWDNYYVENWTPFLDMKILMLTLPAVLAGRGAE